MITPPAGKRSRTDRAGTAEALFADTVRAKKTGTAELDVPPLQKQVKVGSHRVHESQPELVPQTAEVPLHPKGVTHQALKPARQRGGGQAEN
jgi:hypothetical protein